VTIDNYDLIIFDLDGTLTPSKSLLEPEMAELLIKLLAKKKVAVISGCNYMQFQTQFLSKFPVSSDSFANLILLPVSGTQLYIWRGTWCEQYSENLTSKEKEKIMIALNESLKMTGYSSPEKVFGPIVEDRGSQVTFSGLGQQAPLVLKSAWDPGRIKREKIAEILRKKIPEFDVRLGGSTSIDITHRGVNKGYGVRKLEDYLKISSDRILFVGDALFQGGNDYPAKATGIDCIQVKGPEETKNIIQEWLA
jgi:phosphomannomutase